MRYARIYEPELTLGGGMSFEGFKSANVPPAESPGGSRTEWQTALDVETALIQAEEQVAVLLDVIRIAKHYRANNGIVNAQLISRITSDPNQNATLDLTGSLSVINP